MFATKTFPAQTQLLAAITASAQIPGNSLQGWTLDYGIPSRRDEQHLWVDDAIEDWTQGAPTTGLSGREETFRIPVFIYVRRTGATAEDLRDMIVAAADVVADVVGADPLLGGLLLYSEIVTGGYDSAFADPSGRIREAVLQLGVNCRAYLA